MSFRLTQVLCLAALPLLAGCDEMMTTMPGAQPAEPEGPPPLPAAVVAALPEGTPRSVVFQNTDGCWLFSIEETDPPSGYQIRDSAGTPICGAAEPSEQPAVELSSQLDPVPETL
ncbi:hypothetical protein [Pseudoroseicyclus aestuarii]|uniref:Lipoprotein n=1 Tax=Pseudoroseicyclus aestuarii TaxID=1795041 RepID=A0A318SWP6_9RHOB|nr:hypothetical protein [Pseudoroseicyclus aestuarii]PYE84806.1 hypothetical protein DFP88_102609 [Pseudoroseicyclus aestuarii]